MNRSLAIYHQDAENRACDLYYPLMDEYYPVKNLVQMIRQGKVPTHFKQSAIEYIAKYQLSLANSRLHDGNHLQARKLINSCSGTQIYVKKWLVLYLCSFVPPVFLKSLIKARHISRGRVQ
jgi:hypothetical protein